MAAATLNLSQDDLDRINDLKRTLGTADAESTVAKALEIAKYVTDISEDPAQKLLMEHAGKFQELKLTR